MLPSEGISIRLPGRRLTPCPQAQYPASMDPLLNHRPGEHPDPASQPNELMPSNVSLITADDLYLFNEGSHFHLYDKLGAHATTVQGVEGTYFAVWAPEAEQVSVFGTFNQWDASRHPLRPCQSSGIWEGFIPGVGVGALYKFHIRSRHYGAELIKTDPFARLNEIPPKFASVVWSLDYTWQDMAWIQSRARHNALDAPSASTKCISVPGCGSPAKATAHSAIGKWRRTHRVREAARIHPRGVPAGHGASVLCFLGLSNHGLLRPDRPVSDRRRTSCTS